MIPAPNPPSLADVRTAIKDELDRNNKYLEFAQAQIEKDRSFYKYLATVAATALVIILTAAGYFMATSLGQMRGDMEKSLQAELAKLRAEAGAGTAESKRKVDDELANVRTEVQKKVDNEFKSENINATVREAAQRIGQTEVRRIVNEEVAKEVAKGVEAQRSGMDAAARLGGLAQQVNDLFQPNRRAFDELVRIANAHNAASPSARDVADQVIQHWDENFKDPTFAGTQLHASPFDTPEALERVLKESTNPDERRIALMRYSPATDPDKRAIPALLKIIMNGSDPDLYFAALAVLRFNQLEHTAFHVGDWTKISEYWNSQRR